MYMKTSRTTSLITICVLCFCFVANAQDSRAPSSNAKQVYVESFGPAGLYVTVNYDMRFKPQPNGFGLRVGAGV